MRRAGADVYCQFDPFNSCKLALQKFDSSKHSTKTIDHYFSCLPPPHSTDSAEPHPAHHPTTNNEQPAGRAGPLHIGATHANDLPQELLSYAMSLVAQSRSFSSSLKPEEEIARPYACAEIACRRYSELTHSAFAHWVLIAVVSYS